MKILMFGWEYPPHISGGLGTACQGLTEALVKKGHDISFVIPKAENEIQQKHFNLISASNVPLPPDLVITGFSLLNKLIPNIDSKSFDHIIKDRYKFSGTYGIALMEEVYWYAIVATKLIVNLEFDVIHAHDWPTYLAGILVKEISGKPLIVHVHATEFDRSAIINKQVFEIERQGMMEANKVMAVSKLTREIIINNYKIEHEKIVVTYNGVKENDQVSTIIIKRKKEKIVTFLGRITYQKGPEYFIEAAEMVLRKERNVRFVMAGNGDLLKKMITLVATKKLSNHFHFTGFLKGKEVDKLLAMTDVFVMPSVSEPFGIVPLEAIQHNIPVIISKQSGISEVLPHAIKIDYWNTYELANSIYLLLHQKRFANKMKMNNKTTLRKLTWNNTANTVNAAYFSVA
jgi:glycogen synthase